MLCYLYGSALMEFIRGVDGGEDSDFSMRKWEGRRPKGWDKEAYYRKSVSKHRRIGCAQFAKFYYDML